jgi:hypothetical protein
MAIDFYAILKVTFNYLPKFLLNWSSSLKTSVLIFFENRLILIRRVFDELSIGKNHETSPGHDLSMAVINNAALQGKLKNRT